MAARERRAADRVENDVVEFGALGEICCSVIDDDICAEDFYQIHIRRAAYATDMRAKMLGELNRKHADRTAGAVNEDLLPGLQPGKVAQKRECRQCSERNGGGFFKAQLFRFGDDCARFANGKILRIGAADFHPEHFVADTKFRHLCAHRRNNTGEFHACDGITGP